MIAFRRILHPTDFSRASAPAGRQAVALARACRALLGSVADRVIRLAPCPVMTVRDTE